MSQYNFDQPTLQASPAQVEARSAFIVKTYNHLLSAILGFTLFEVMAAVLILQSWLDAQADADEPDEGSTLPLSGQGSG